MTEQEKLQRSFQKLATGDLDALGEIYDLCASDLYGLALWRTKSKEDAADLLQDVFVHLSQRRCELEKIRNPKGFLLTMAHRMALDLVRRNKTLRLVSLEECALLEARAVLPETAADTALASRALEQIPEDQREAIYLRHFCDLSYSEIGSVQGVSTFTSASRVRLGMKRLRRILRTEPTR